MRSERNTELKQGIPGRMENTGKEEIGSGGPPMKGGGGGGSRE
jgi:hypothetical protein